MPIARRGEVWRVDLGLVAKVRPALVLSVPFNDQERAVFAIVPHTTSIRGGRFEIKLKLSRLEPGAFDAQGLRNVPALVLIEKLAVLGPQQLEEIETAVKQWLGLQ